MLVRMSSQCRPWVGPTPVAFTLDRYGRLREKRDSEIQDRLDVLLDARYMSKTCPENVVDPGRKRRIHF